MLHEIKTKKLLREKIQIIQRSIINSRVYRPANVSKFVFICGANKDKDSISERRKALIDFSTRHLKHTQFFLAERMFLTLQKEGHKGNILDVEHDISEFADHIIIILESPSAFAELGAFAHAKLRNKLIIINDKKYESENSFINLGPIKAIRECTGDLSVINYKMSSDGIHRLDAIGDVFDPLYELLKELMKGRATAINIDNCDPSKNFDKNSAMFIHDLIHFTGPISRNELIEILKIIFGNSNFKKITEHLAILTAFESIHLSENGFYKSNICKTYYTYKFDTNKIISTFKNYILKSYQERIYAN